MGTWTMATVPRGAASARAPRVLLGAVLMAASGAAALGYQIVWTQQAALWLGHEAASVLAVVTAFFFGVGLGAWVLSPRLQALPPWRAYAACEAAIGAWALVLSWLQAPVAGALLSLIGERPSPAWHWGVAFGGTTLLLLPATLAMGATLPLVDRALRASHGGGRLGTLYAANTAGGMVGVLCASLWALPQWGLPRTGALCAALSLAVSVVAWRRGNVSGPTPAAAQPRVEWRPLAWLAATGLLGIGHEVAMVRVLSQVAEDTVYTFALLLAVYLGGTALGGAAWQAWQHDATNRRTRLPAPQRLRRLLQLTATACALSALAAWQAGPLHAAALAGFGPGMNAALAAEAAVGLAVFALPTLSMGALFTELCTQARAAGQGLGRALGVNTLGAALAPPLFGLLLIPLGGLKGAMLVLVGAYALLAWAADAPRPRALPFAATAALLGAAALLLPPLRQVDLAPGARIVDYRDGVSASVSVTEDADGTRRLRIDNREQEGSSDSLSADARQALLPLLLHPSPRRVLFLGLGTGTTASVAASDPSLQVQVAELLPEVAAARGWFTRDRFDDSAQARLQVLAADARREVLTATQPLDVVIADNFHPARSGSAALYTVEHFAAVRARLAERGLFCQWLPLHQLDLATLRSIVASFMAVYPQGGALLATHSLQTPVIGLVGRRDGRPFRLADIRRRLADPAWPAALRPASFGLQDAWPVAGALAAGPAALRRWSAGAPLNRDAHPVVAWMAPRNAYAPQDTPAERLLQWIGDMDVAPGELVEAEAQDTRRLQAWRAARTQFLQAGLHVRPSPDAAHMLAQVRAPLLAVLRTSPDFRPAYEPLMAIAQALAPSDPVLAQQVLQELAALAMPAPTNHSVGASVP